MLKEAGPGGAHEHTLLMIMGDHGQTDDGDHGGSTPDEINTAVAAFNLGKWRRRQLAEAKQPEGQSPGAAAAEPVCTASQQGSCTAQLPTMSQIDLTPTLSMLLGVPIPYGNLGKVPAQVWNALTDSAPVMKSEPASDGDGDGPSEPAPVQPPSPSPEEAYTSALAANAFQVHRYLNEYAKVSNLPASEVECLAELYHNASRLARAAGGPQAASAAGDSGKRPSSSSAANCAPASPGADGIVSPADAYLAFLDRAAVMARDYFTRFDHGHIRMGVAGSVLLVLGLLFIAR